MSINRVPSIFTVFLFCCFSSLTCHDLDTITSKITSQFFTTNIQLKTNAQFTQSLGKFQADLLKNRNFACPSEFVAWQTGNTNPLEFENFEKIIIGLNDICWNSSQLIDLLGLDEAKLELNKTRKNLFDLVVTQLKSKGCGLCAEDEQAIIGNKITPTETWTYGLVFVTIISMSSLCGAFVIPLSNKKFYKKVLMMMIGVAVGSLAGSGFLHLLPQAFGIADDPNYASDHDYVWKGIVMMCGVYLFYLVERILKIMILRKKMKRSNSLVAQKRCNDGGDEIRQLPILESIGYIKTHETPVDPNVEMRMHIDDKVMIKYNNTDKKHGHSHNHLQGFHSIAPVAWMIIFGDGLHNFIDGLSIGAAFTESKMKGISICLAVICEEFPHELGDFAILLNAGMSYKAALFFNFLSACSCYAGLAVGIVLGDNFSANQWIYAIAGGMFLYIALSDMVPELNEMGEEIERDYILEKQLGLLDAGKISEEESNLNEFEKTGAAIELFDLRIKLKVLFMQNFGIVLGFSIMALMAMNPDGIIKLE